MKVLVFKTAALCRGVKRIRQTKLHYAVQNSQSQYCAGQHRMMSKGKHHNDGQRKLPDHSCQHSHNQDENSLALALSCSVPERVGIICTPQEGSGSAHHVGSQHSSCQHPPPTCSDKLRHGAAKE